LTVGLLTYARVGETVGGVEKFVSSLGNWLSCRSCTPVIVSRGLQNPVRVILPSVPTEGRVLEVQAREKYYPSPALIEIVYSFAWVFLTVSKILNLNKTYKFDILHAHDDEYSGAAAVIASRLLRVPVVIHLHGLNIRTRYLKMLDNKSGSSLLSRLVLTFDFLLERHVIRRADAVVAVSDEVKRYHALARNAIEKFVLIPCGIDPSEIVSSGTLRVQYRSQLGIDEDETTIGFVGRLSAEKNPATLLRACSGLLSKPLPGLRCRLLLVGGGPLEGQLLQLAQALRIRDRVIFLGVRHDVPAILNSLDIFVSSSIDEGSPLSLLEAMAAGCAVLGSDIPSIREVVRDGETGLLFSPCDAEDLDRHLVTLCTSPHLRVSLGRKAREFVLSYHNIDQIYSKITELYASVRKPRSDVHVRAQHHGV